MNPTRTVSTALVAAALATAGAAAPASARPKTPAAQAPLRDGATGVVDRGDGVAIHYEVHGGAGEPLVLLHGGLGATGMFGPVLPALAARHQVIGVDLQGHGASTLGDRRMDSDAMADDVAAVLDALGVPAADVAGYSLGGAIAYRLAVRHPDRVRRLVAVSAPTSSAGWYPDLRAQMITVSSAAAEAMKPSPMYQLYAQLQPRVGDWPRLLDAIGALIREEYDWTADIAALPMPILFVVGDADAVRFDHLLAVFARFGGGKRDAGWDGAGRPRAQLAVLPGTTHYDIGVSPALADAVNRFLATPAAPGAGVSTDRAGAR